LLKPGLLDVLVESRNLGECVGGNQPNRTSLWVVDPHQDYVDSLALDLERQSVAVEG